MSYSAQYLAAVDQAVQDLNMATSREITSDGLMRLVSWSIRRGKNLPWFKYHEREVISNEGGWESCHSAVLSLTLGLLSADHDLPLPDAAEQAGEEWRTNIRRQYDCGNGLVLLDSIEDMAEHRLVFLRDGSDTSSILKDQIVAQDRMVQQNPDPSPFDETQITDPRLVAAWEIADERERELLRHVAEGVPQYLAGQLCGGYGGPAHAPGESLAASRLRKLRSKIAASKGFAVGF
jgi:hypothetical protein